MTEFLQQPPPSWWQPSMPVGFRPLAEELASARAGRAVADGSLFSILEMTGPDRHEFLNRLLTNTPPTRPGDHARAYYLTVMGRPLAQLFLYEREGSTLIVCPASQRETAFAELDKMHFGEKLRLAPLETPLTLSFGGQGLPLDYFSVPAALHLGSAPDGEPIGAQALEVLRIERGTAAPGDYFEKTLFLEIAEPNDYSETKGCYPGQEVVARTLHRGHINRHLKLITLEGEVPAREARLLQGEREVGTVASAVCSPNGVLALAYLRREVWESGTRLQLAGTERFAEVS